MNVYEVMEQGGIVIPPAPQKGGLYAGAKQFGEGLIYISGCGPVTDVAIKGKLGREFDTQQGMDFARAAMLNVLAVLEDAIGDLNRVKSVVKILCFVASDDEFYEQPMVANGATALLKELFGERAGMPSRSAIGVNVLPGNLPVEIEAIFEIGE